MKEMDEDMTKPLPHGVDMYKEDLDGPLWWLQDNDYLYRGYRTQLSFWETFKRYLCDSVDRVVPSVVQTKR